MALYCLNVQAQIHLGQCVCPPPNFTSHGLPSKLPSEKMGRSFAPAGGGFRQPSSSQQNGKVLIGCELHAKDCSCPGRAVDGRGLGGVSFNGVLVVGCPMEFSPHRTPDSPSWVKHSSSGHSVMAQRGGT